MNIFETLFESSDHVYTKYLLVVMLAAQLAQNLGRAELTPGI